MPLLSASSLAACGITGKSAVLAAFSGGADSTALALALMGLMREGTMRSLTLAHVNHGIRGAEADHDEAFCRDFAARFSLPLSVIRVDAPLEAAQTGHSLEQAARDVRYAALRRAAAACGAEVIAVAHHRDDQAETVLLHLIRGSGLCGLCGMRARSGDIARPLLSVSRKEILTYLAEQGQDFCVDSTNASPDALRNRVRHELLPLLETMNPAIVPALCRMASHAREDEDLLSALADTAGADADGNRRSLLALPPALLNRVLLASLRAQTDTVEERDVDKLRSLLAARTGTTVPLREGLHACVDGERLTVGRLPQRAEYALPLAPGEPALTPFGRLTVRYCDSACVPCRPWEAYLDAACIKWPLTVRPYRQGERFRPLGCGGSKLLSDYFSDRKVPRYRRDLPLVCDGCGVLYVAGHTVDERAKVTEQTERVLYISYEEEPNHVGQ